MPFPYTGSLCKLSPTWKPLLLAMPPELPCFLWISPTSVLLPSLSNEGNHSVTVWALSTFEIRINVHTLQPANAERGKTTSSFLWLTSESSTKHRASTLRALGGHGWKKSITSFTVHINSVKEVVFLQLYFTSEDAEARGGEITCSKPYG